MAVCPECGFVVPEGKRFCANCGQRIDADYKRAAPKPDQAWSAGPKPFDEPKRWPLDDDDGYDVPRAPNKVSQNGETARGLTDGLPGTDAYERTRPRNTALYEWGPHETVRSGQPYAAGAGDAAQKPGKPPLTVRECLLSMLLASIPVAGLVIGFTWAKRPQKPSRHNLSVAMVVFNGTLTLLGILVFMAIKLIFRPA
jgi:hypothetical protein